MVAYFRRLVLAWTRRPAHRDARERGLGAPSCERQQVGIPLAEVETSIAILDLRVVVCPVLTVHGLQLAVTAGARLGVGGTP